MSNYNEDNSEPANPGAAGAYVTFFMIMTIIAVAAAFVTFLVTDEIGLAVINGGGVLIIEVVLLIGFVYFGNRS